jgi:acetyl-CoA C-acetyltransferase
MKGEAYMSMLDTAEVVAKRYNISRERQDEYGLESQRRTVSAQQAGRFNEELAPITTTMAVVDKATGTTSYQKVTLSFDEGMRPDTTAEGLAQVKPAKGPGFTITAGNASQLSDGASAAVIMSDNGRSRQARLEAVRHFPRLCRAWLRARRDGCRPRLCGAAVAQAARPENR